jgi:hypothetical protein
MPLTISIQTFTVIIVIIIQMFSCAEDAIGATATLRITARLASTTATALTGNPNGLSLV